jgi:hypothetical protein
MSILLLVLFSGFLLALMVWLRWTAKTLPNADLLLETMRTHLEDGRNSEGRTP